MYRIRASAGNQIIIRESSFIQGFLFIFISSYDLFTRRSTFDLVLNNSARARARELLNTMLQGSYGFHGSLESPRFRQGRTMRSTTD